MQRYCDSGGDFAFESADAGIKPPAPRDLTRHFDEFMKAQDVLVPPFGSAGAWLDLPRPHERPAKVTIRAWEEFSASNIPRVDLIALA